MHTPMLRLIDSSLIGNMTCGLYKWYVTEVTSGFSWFQPFHGLLFAADVSLVDMVVDMGATQIYRLWAETY